MNTGREVSMGRGPEVQRDWSCCRSQGRHSTEADTGAMRGGKACRRGADPSATEGRGTGVTAPVKDGETNVRGQPQQLSRPWVHEPNVLLARDERGQSLD